MVDNTYNNYQLKRVQKEVLNFILLGNTPADISIQRRTSPQAVYKTINQLIEKRVLKPDWKKGLKKTYPLALKSSKRLKQFYRLHGVEFHIIPLYFSRYYNKEELKNKIFTYYGWTIRLYKESLEVYSGDFKDWRGESINRVTALMEQEFNRLLSRLENRLRIIIIKDQKLNIEQVNQHYAHVNNGIATELNKDKLAVTLYGQDGKARFKVDFSTALIELEGIHPETAKEDMRRVCEKQLNDWADNNPPTNSELANHIKKLADLQTAYNIENVRHYNNIALYNENIVKHLAVLEEMSQTLKEIKKHINGG